MKNKVFQKVEFWHGTTKHNNFKDLATYALTCLITPANNAIVDIIFSLVTAILSNAICCIDVECTANMLKLPDSVDLCHQNESTSINDDEAEYIP